MSDVTKRYEKSILLLEIMASEESKVGYKMALLDAITALKIMKDSEYIDTSEKIAESLMPEITNLARAIGNVLGTLTKKFNEEPEETAELLKMKLIEAIMD